MNCPTATHGCDDLRCTRSGRGQGRSSSRSDGSLPLLICDPSQSKSILRVEIIVVVVVVVVSIRGGGCSQLWRGERAVRWLRRCLFRVRVGSVIDERHLSSTSWSGACLQDCTLEGGRRAVVASSITICYLILSVIAVISPSVGSRSLLPRKDSELSKKKKSRVDWKSGDILIRPNHTV